MAWVPQGSAHAESPKPRTWPGRKRKPAKSPSHVLPGRSQNGTRATSSLFPGTSPGGAALPPSHRARAQLPSLRRCVAGSDLPTSRTPAPPFPDRSAPLRPLLSSTPQRATSTCPGSSQNDPEPRMVRGAEASSSRHAPSARSPARDTLRSVAVRALAPPGPRACALRRFAPAPRESPAHAPVLLLQPR